MLPFIGTRKRRPTKRIQLKQSSFTILQELLTHRMGDKRCHHIQVWYMVVSLPQKTQIMMLGR